MKKLLVLTILYINQVVSLLLSKSSISMCENKGLHGYGDPKNLVEGATCKKKLLVLLTVRNNQKGTEKLHATVSRVRDDTSNDYARLYNPFMITVSKSPVYIIYPYFYTGYMVNNLPYEEIRMTRGSWWASDSSKQCYDQWQPTEREQLKPTCGYQYKSKDVKQADGTYKKVKQRIWDSQGFCCHCTGEEKDAYLNNEARNFKRSGLTCRLFTSNTQASGHCMKMDPLWYNVYSFTESYRDFTIHVKAFDQIEKVIKNRTRIEYVNGGEIVLSPSEKSGVGKYQRIIAHYVGDFAPVKSYPVLTSKYFLVPKIDGKLNENQHPQMKYSFAKYLILPMSFVDLRGGKCNTIGVSYSSFKNQASAGRGYGCHQKKGWCLNNQPYHFFKEDDERLYKGKMPHWFPSRYGKLAGVKRKKKNSSNFVLAYELEEEHVSLVSLQISADDLILVYNRATGEILRAAVRDFESVSMDGKLQVEILNTGYVTSDFYVTVSSCSKEIDKIAEKSLSIDPQVTEKIIFSLRSSDQTGGENYCVIRLYDSKRVIIGKRNVSFSTTAPCVCEVSGCRCECKEDGGVRCVEMEGKWNISDKIWTVKKTSGLLGNIGKFFTNVFNSISRFFENLFGFNLMKYLKYVLVVIAVGLIGCCLLRCGVFASCCTSCCTSCCGSLGTKSMMGNPMDITNTIMKSFKQIQGVTNAVGDNAMLEPEEGEKGKRGKVIDKQPSTKHKVSFDLSDDSDYSYEEEDSSSIDKHRM